MGKWTRITAGPIFRYARHTIRGPYRVRYISVGGEIMRVRRVISDTAAWVERASGPEAFAFLTDDRSTPFVRSMRHGDGKMAHREWGRVPNDL